MDGIMRQTISRRGIIGGLAAGGAGAVLVTVPRLGGTAKGSTAQATPAPATPTPATPTGPFTLPPLPYDYAALEPHIDVQTMQIHHDKHHQAYVDNLNKAVADLPDLHAMSADELIRNLDQVPEDKRGAVRNNAGGHVNHTLFWELMGPGGGGEPTGPVAEAISASFGDFITFQDAVTTAGLGRFGSGWAWVTIGTDGKLEITSTPNQDNPVMEGGPAPILGIDVWEHAYYLKYQNKRKDYLTAWWNTVNWQTVNARYEQALAG